MFTHNLDPVFLDFGFLSIRWYSLAYIAGVLIGWWMGKKILLKKFKGLNDQFEVKDFDNLITYIIISMIIGGRIGYAIFYNFKYYFFNPLEIIKIWEGGMSFHGALIGIIIGTYLYSYQRKISSLIFLDVISCVAPIGIFFGRIANFINGELIGKTTSVPWGVIFPKIDMVARHPSQLYEAFLEGFVLFIILNIFINKKDYIVGTCSCLFLICYGCLRIVSEIFREADAQVGYFFNFLSMGSILSIIMIFSGLILLNFISKKYEK